MVVEKEACVLDIFGEAERDARGFFGERIRLEFGEEEVVESGCTDATDQQSGEDHQHPRAFGGGLFLCFEVGVKVHIDDGGRAFIFAAARGTGWSGVWALEAIACEILFVGGWTKGRSDGRAG